MPTPFDIALQQLVVGGGALPPATRAAAARSLQRYSGAVADNVMEAVLGRFFDGLKSIAAPRQEPREDGTTATVGDTPETVRANITALVQRFSNIEDLAEEMKLDFKIKVAREVTAGAGRFVADQTTVDAYPAWELRRVYERRMPRGEEPKNPSDPWPVRWAQAAAELPDSDAILGIYQSTGRMIALKSSEIWQRLGDGVGGHDDALGNPFAPFAFNSGYDTGGVSRRECIELGLLRRDEQPQRSQFNWDQLIQLPEAA